MVDINLQAPSALIRQSPELQIQMQSLTAEDIQEWLVAQISGQLRIYPDEIDIYAPFSSYGLSSLQAMAIAALGKEHLGLPLSPLVIWNFPNVALLSEFLAAEMATSEVDRFEI